MTTFCEQHLPPEERMITPTIKYLNLVHTPLIITGSTLIIATTLLCNNFRKLDHFLQMYLAFIDLLVGVVEIPFELYVQNATEGPLTNKTVCILKFTLTDWAYFSSLILLTTITIYKSIAINVPFCTHNFELEKNGRKSLYVSLLGLTVNSVVVVRFNFYAYDASSNKKCHEENIPAVFRNYVKFIMPVLCLLLCTIICLQLLWVVNRQKAKLRARNQRVGKNTYVVIFLNFLFIVLWIPTITLIQKDTRHYCVRKFIARQFRNSNSFANIFIYAAINRDQRAAYRFLLTNKPWNWNHLNDHMRSRLSSRFIQSHRLTVSPRKIREMSMMSRLSCLENRQLNSGGRKVSLASLCIGKMNYSKTNIPTRETSNTYENRLDEFRSYHEDNSLGMTVKDAAKLDPFRYSKYVVRFQKEAKRRTLEEDRTEKIEKENAELKTQKSNISKSPSNSRPYTTSEYTSTIGTGLISFSSSVDPSSKRSSVRPTVSSVKCQKTKPL